MGKRSDGLLPIKMTDEPPSAAFSHTNTHTHMFFYTLTQTYRTVGDKNKPVMRHSPPGGFKPEKHNPFGLCVFPPPFSCSLPHSFLSPVHASGIPLDPLNEGHITGLAKRGE